MTHKLPLSEQLEHFREQIDQTHENFDLAYEARGLIALRFRLF